MYDAERIVEAIKIAALDAIESTYPVQVCYGRVVSVDPLQVRISQQLTLSEQQLHLTSAVTDKTYTVPVPELEAQGITEITIKLDDGLKAGDIVILLRMQGGQKYIILDRVVI